MCSRISISAAIFAFCLAVVIVRSEEEPELRGLGFKQVKQSALTRINLRKSIRTKY